LAATITAGLRLLPFRSLRRWLASSAAQGAGSQPDTRPNPAHLARAVRRVSRYIPAANCLPQALATQWLLQRHGYPAELRLGVAKNGSGQLKAHAWVDSEGQTLIGWLPDLSRYTLLPSLDEAADPGRSGWLQV
jgi:hypothetical protein